MFDWINSPEAWIALATLTSLEVVLGIDNIIFLTILTDRLPPEQRPKARFIGLALAMVMRLILLGSLAWMVGLTADLFTVFDHGVSGRDLVLFFGGLFLLGKASMEIHEEVEVPGGHQPSLEKAAAASFAGVMVQVALLDMVFSLDSVITAVGMVDDIAVMVIAVIIAIIFMMVFAGPVGRFVSDHPTVKVLALSFLVLIGTALVADAMAFHIPKGYIYFAMAFSFGVEMLNLRMRARRRARAPEGHG